MKKFLTVQMIALVVLICSSVNSFAEPSWDQYEDAAEFYVCMYNKPGEAAGLEYWAVDIETHGEEYTANAFVSCTELDIGTMTNAQFVTRLYNKALNREPDTEGFNYWVGRLASATKGTVMREFISGIDSQTGSEDKSLFDNKALLGTVYGHFKGYEEVCPTDYCNDLGITYEQDSYYDAIDIIRNQ